MTMRIGRGALRRRGTSIVLLILLGGCAQAPRCDAGPCADDRSLAATVQARIDANAALRVDGIGVHVLDHVAYLTGLVDTELERAEAVEAARGVPSITAVHEELGVLGNR